MKISAKFFVAFTMILTGCGAAKSYTVSKAASPQPERRAEEKKVAGSLGVLPFENTTKKPELEWWEQGLADMLTTDFAGVEGLQVVERRQLHKVLEEAKLSLSGLIDETTAKKVGKLMGVDMVVTGSIAVAGGQVRVDARVLHVETGKVLAASSSVGVESEMLTMERALAEALTRRMGYAWTAPPMATQTGSAAVPSGTAMEEAIEHHAAGLKHMEAGETDQAIEAFKQAVQLHSTYAKAYANLAWAYQTKGTYEAAGVALEKALAITPHSVEVQLLTGWNHHALGQYDRTIEMAKKVLGVQAARASHQEARLLLGMAWRDKGEHGLARKELEALMATDTLNHGNYSGLPCQ